MNNPTSLRGRVNRLETETNDGSVVGIITTRGGVFDPAEQLRVRQQIDALRGSGRAVYFANLAVRLAPPHVTADTLLEQEKSNG